VIFGGMTVSTLFTLVLMPALLQLGEAKVARRDSRLVLQPAE
jgi:Cu/Ag efflux pump CusA